MNQNLRNSIQTKIITDILPVKGSSLLENSGGSEVTGENVRVFVRIRPLTPQENSFGHNSILEPVNNNGIVIWDPTSFEISNRPELASINPSCWSRNFVFDTCLWSMDESDANFSTQEDVYETVGQPIVDWALDGHNCCVFAYGQTGAGKSYTMMGNMKGNARDYGLIPRICFGLFDALDSCSQINSTITNMSLEFSHMEIYNETVKDLLTPSKNGQLKVREHPQAGVTVVNLTTVRVANFDEVLSLIKIGDKARTVAATNLNLHSSRSHAIVTLTLRQSFRLSRDDGVQAPLQHKSSRIHLVDLAGSERISNSGAKGVRLRETNNINKSLSVLGDVIKSLGERKCTKKSHIPYRNSLLTMVLKDSLGGNSHTVMIAAVSPAIRDYEETMGTLKYADRAKRVRMVVQANIMASELQSSNAAELVPLLTAEVHRLREMLQAQQKQAQKEPVVTGVPEEVRVAVIEMQQRVRELENQLEEREQLIITLVAGRQDLDGAIDAVPVEPIVASARKRLDGVNLPFPPLPPSSAMNSSYYSNTSRLDLSAFSPPQRPIMNNGSAVTAIATDSHKSRNTNYAIHNQLIYRASNGPNSSIEVIPLPDDECIIGSHSVDADLVFKGPEIAPQHCVLLPDPHGHVWLCPIQKSVVWVNGMPVLREHALEHGDQIIIGKKLELRFEQVTAEDDSRHEHLSRLDERELSASMLSSRVPSLDDESRGSSSDVPGFDSNFNSVFRKNVVGELAPVRSHNGIGVSNHNTAPPNSDLWWEELQRVADDTQDLESEDLREVLQAVLSKADSKQTIISPRSSPGPSKGSGSVAMAGAVPGSEKGPIPLQPLPVPRSTAFGKSLHQKLISKQQHSPQVLADISCCDVDVEQHSMMLEQEAQRLTGDPPSSASGSTSKASSPSPSPSQCSRGSSDLLDGYAGSGPPHRGPSAGHTHTHTRDQSSTAPMRPTSSGPLNTVDPRPSTTNAARRMPSAAELLRVERMKQGMGSVVGSVSGSVSVSGSQDNRSQVSSDGGRTADSNSDENVNSNSRSSQVLKSVPLPSRPRPSGPVLAGPGSGPVPGPGRAGIGTGSGSSINVALLQRLRGGDQSKTVDERCHNAASQSLGNGIRMSSDEQPMTTVDTSMTSTGSGSFESEATELELELAQMQKALRDRMHRYRELQVTPMQLKNVC